MRLPENLEEDLCPPKPFLSISQGDSQRGAVLTVAPGRFWRLHRRVLRLMMRSVPPQTLAPRCGIPRAACSISRGKTRGRDKAWPRSDRPAMLLSELVTAKGDQAPQ